ncbi:MAG: hypothetical protein ACQETI_07390 [Halobacteriota archaeon]
MNPDDTPFDQLIRDFERLVTTALTDDPAVLTSSPRFFDSPLALDALLTTTYVDGDEVVVVADLDGIDSDAIAVAADGRTCTLRVTSGTVGARQTVVLPVAVESVPIRQRLANGVLTVVFRRADVADV